MLHSGGDKVFATAGCSALSGGERKPRGPSTGTPLARQGNSESPRSFSNSSVARSHSACESRRGTRWSSNTIPVRDLAQAATSCGLLGSGDGGAFHFQTVPSSQPVNKV